MHIRVQCTPWLHSCDPLHGSHSHSVPSIDVVVMELQRQEVVFQCSLVLLTLEIVFRPVPQRSRDDEFRFIAILRDQCIDAIYGVADGGGSDGQLFLIVGTAELDSVFIEDPIG